MKTWYSNSHFAGLAYRVDWIHPLTHKREVYARCLSLANARTIAQAVAETYSRAWFERKAQTFVEQETITPAEYLAQLKQTVNSNPGYYGFEWKPITDIDSRTLYDVDSGVARTMVQGAHTALKLTGGLGALVSLNPSAQHAVLSECLLDYDINIYDVLKVEAVGYYLNGTFYFKTDQPNSGVF